MCRVLAYLGKPITLDELLYHPDSSLIKQSYSPVQMKHILNLAGFGFMAWHNRSHKPKDPFIYKTEGLPFYDSNLENLSNKLKANCLLAHVRGVGFTAKEIISKQNIHPFMFDKCNVALAHNGELHGCHNMKTEIYEHIKPELVAAIKGTTDSEIIYALLMSQLENPYAEHTVDEMSDAILKTFNVIKLLREKHGHTNPSPINLFITNGDYVILTRYVFNYGAFKTNKNSSHYAYHTLWYTFGEEYTFVEDEYKMTGGSKKHSVMFASEPLTHDITTWIEVPEYSLVKAFWRDDQITIQTEDLDL